MHARPLVLVVDDDAGTRELVRSILADEGYQVDTASNGDAALASLRLDHPDVILLDVRMPVLDGWGFRAAQLALPAARDIPVVLVSASGPMEPPSPELAPAVTLAKPFDVDQLLAALERVLGPAARPEPAPSWSATTRGAARRRAGVLTKPVSLEALAATVQQPP
jgi:CheY-like chemotaxis protein